MTGTTQPTLDIQRNGPMWFVVAHDIEKLPAAEAIAWFVEPAKLRQWWGDEHAIDPRSGGKYIVRWPSIGRTLRGSDSRHR